MIEKISFSSPFFVENQHKQRTYTASPPVKFTSDAAPQVHRKIGAIKVLNPKFDLSKVKVILWDLDGTLYSQNVMLHQFWKDFREYFPDALKPIYDAKSREVLQGTSLFRVGHSYDPVQKLILRKDHNGNVRYAYTIDGKPVPEKKLKVLYPKPLKGDEGIIHIDNKIKALEVLGVSLGKMMQEADTAYFATRARYFKSLEGKTPSPGLAEFLHALRVRGHVHLISTYAPLVGLMEMLDQLKIFPVLHKVHTGVSKPMGMEQLIHDVMKEHGVRANQILCIGNEAGMDLIVPHRMGAQTLLIEEDPGQNLEGVDATVSSLQDLLKTLEHFPVH